MPTLFKYATIESRYYYLPFIELKTEAQKLTQGANVGAAIKAGTEGTYLNIIKLYMTNPQQALPSMVKN